MTITSLLGKNATKPSLIHQAGCGKTGAALCRGGAPKRYPFVDANEDALLIASDGARYVLAVADAHHGTLASHLAIGWISTRCSDLAMEKPVGDWTSEAAAIFRSIDIGIRENNERHGTQSQTTLILAVVDLTRRLLQFAAAGDSHLISLGPKRNRWHAGFDGNGIVFLGDARRDVSEVGSKLQCGVEELRDATAVILASDGISTPGIGFEDPLAAVAEAARGMNGTSGDDRAATECAARIARAACQAQHHHDSGDNISVIAALV